VTPFFGELVDFMTSGPVVESSGNDLIALADLSAVVRLDSNSVAHATP
jgi:nucleoside diphosphate kinase